MEIFQKLKTILLVYFFVFSSAIFAANPAQPFLPSDNVQDPNCTPLDSNCYVTLTSFANETVDGLDYSTSTGVLSLTSGYTIPTVASTTAWNTALAAGANAALQNGNSFGTTLTLGTNDNQALNFKTDGVTRLTILQNGNVGIGTTTPSSALSVQGVGLFGGGNVSIGDNTSTGSPSSHVAWMASDGYFGNQNTNFGPDGAMYAVLGDNYRFSISDIDNNDAGYNSTNGRFFTPTGVYVGSGSSDFAPITIGDTAGSNAWIDVGGSASFASGGILLNSDGSTNIAGSLTLGTALADGQFVKSGNWTGLFDGQEGTYYLSRANQTGTQLASTILDFSTSTRSLLSSSATGLSYSTTTGIFSLTSGYNIPLTASTTEWASRVSSQWTTSSSNIYYTAGNVGIGTTTPGSKLQVLSTTEQLRLNYDATKYLSTTVDSSGNTSIAQTGTTFSVSGTGYSHFRIGADTGSGPTLEFFTGSANIGGVYADSSRVLYWQRGNDLVSTMVTNLNTGAMGFGMAAAPSAQLHAISTTEQLRLGYNTSNYLSTTIGSTGAVAFDAVGSGAGFGFADNVAIGTTPTTKALQIGALTNTSTHPQMLFASYDSGAGYPQILFNNPGSAYMAIGVASTGDLVFGSSVNSTTWTSQSMVLQQATGNLGIGTTTPADVLQVYGDLRIGTSGTNGCLKNFAGTGLIGSCSSDERLKTNITDLSDGYLDKMNNLKVISYRWNDLAKDLNKVDTSVTNYGLLAQNVEQYFPELITVDSKGYKQVDYSRVPLYLLKSVQELSKKVENFSKEFRTNKLCVGDTCINEEQLKVLLQNQNTQSAQVAAPVVMPVVETPTSTEPVVGVVPVENETPTPDPEPLPES